MTSGKQRVTILGGGPSGLATAFALSEPHLRDQFEVTIYQMGWRAGGLCHSGRVAPEYWVDQNGTHYLFGCYYDALYLLRQAYEELQRQGDQGFGTFREQLIGRPLVVMKQFFAGEWTNWTVEFPVNDDEIGADRPPLTPLALFRQGVRLVLAGLTDGSLLARVLASAHLTELQKAEVEAVMETADAAARKALEALDSDFGEGSGPIGSIARNLLALCVEGLRDALSLVLVPISTVNVDVLRIWTFLDIGTTIIIGMLREDALGAEMIERLDHYDFRAFLQAHGAHPDSVQSPPVAVWYDAMASFDRGDLKRPNCAAGPTLACLFQMVLAYEQYQSFQLLEEVGDSVIGPITQALRYRGVRFKYFHRIWDVVPGDGCVKQVVMERQAQLKSGDDTTYDPFIAPVNNRKVWPDSPRMEQIATTFGNDPADLTNFYCPRKGPDVVLEQGQDYDLLICALSGPTLKWYTDKLKTGSQRWAGLLSNLQGVETQGLRLWFKPTLTEMGWPTDPPVLSAYTLPYATWEDPTPVLKGESWPPDDAPQTVCHLFGPLAFPEEWPAPWDAAAGQAYLARQQARAEAEGTEWLRTQVHALWPNVTLPEDGRAIDPKTCAQPKALSTPWQIKANSGPGEAYLQLVPGTWKYRFKPSDTDYPGFFAVGDWTRTTFPCGSIEAAVSSGLACGEHIAALYSRPDPL